MTGAGESAVEVAVSYDWQVGVGCFLRSLVHLHKRVLTAWWLVSLRVRNPGSQDTKCRDTFYDLDSEGTQSLTPYSLAQLQTPPSSISL